MPRLPRLAQVGKNIEASRIASKTKEAATIGEFLRAKAFERCGATALRAIELAGLAGRHLAGEGPVTGERETGVESGDAVVAAGGGRCATRRRGTARSAAGWSTWGFEDPLSERAMAVVARAVCATAQ